MSLVCTTFLLRDINRTEQFPIAKILYEIVDLNIKYSTRIFPTNIYSVHSNEFDRMFFFDRIIPLYGPI
jgi:hypothetical protein